MNSTRTFRSCIALAIVWLLTLAACRGNERTINLGIFAKDRINDVLGQDGCTPVPLGEITMWTFGDTILGTWKGELTVNSTFNESATMKGMISNSLAFTEKPEDNNVRSLNFHFYKKKGQVSRFIDPKPDENPSIWRFWAIDGIRIDDSVYVYYMIVMIDKALADKNPGSLPFRVTGIGIARWNYPRHYKIGGPVSFVRLGKVFTSKEPVFGDSVIRRGDYLYLIGHAKPKGGSVSAYISRVHKDHLTRRERYEFLDRRGGWTSNISMAQGFFDEVIGELSLSYNRYLNKFIIIYCSKDGTIKTVYCRSLSELSMAQAKIIYTPEKLPEKKTGPAFFYYSGKEIFYTKSAIYAIYINPAIYQPILLKIPYRLLPE